MGKASLPMYDLPELREVTDAWWQGLARHLKKAGMLYLPQRLERPQSLYAHWSDPALLFSQTCGFPLMHALTERPRVIGTPCYDAPGCSGPRYSSLVIVPAAHPARKISDLRGARCVINAPDSHSGYNALRILIAPHAHGQRFFSAVLKSGGHRESLAMIRRGEGEVCALDGVVYGLLQRYAPVEIEGTRVLLQSPTAPGLPYITASVVTLKELRAGVAAAFADPDLAETRAALLLSGFEILPDNAYSEIRNMEAAAKKMGYPTIE